MKKNHKNRLINCTAFLILYGFLVSSFFDKEPSFQRGAAQGTAIIIPLILLLIGTLTIFFTLKNGGNWKKIQKNLKHNFVGLISFSWKEKK